MNGADSNPLDQLRLSPEELAAVQRSGVVVEQLRGRRVVYRLRFRVQGKLRNFYLSRDGPAPELVRDALHQHRQERREDRQLITEIKKLVQETRAFKKALKQPLQQQGLYQHGFEIRSFSRKNSLSLSQDNEA